MDDDIYVSVLLTEYIDLVNLRQFFYLLKDMGVEEWEGWAEAVDEFLAEEELSELPA